MADTQSLILPSGAKILSVIMQRREIVLYAMVDLSVKVQDRFTFEIYGTGHEIRHGDGYTFLGTLDHNGNGDLIWHIFYKKY
ncbi:MAG: hypothetical protein LBI53_02350 [Candidatus Peribacteria bacterium]|nr:hypothetical protein [Candidatus Peribacteria bacterium]